MSEPNGEFLRRGQIVNWLEAEFGISPKTTRKLIENGKIVLRKLTPHTWPVARKSQIKADLQLNKT